MIDDATLALLGDRAAQERITARGELLPCPLCGAELRNHSPTKEDKENSMNRKKGGN